MNRRPGYSFLGVLALLCILPARAATMHLLDEVPGQLKTPEGKSVWQQQMEGKPGPDGLGVRLPPGWSAPDVSGLLLPAGDRRAPALVGAKRWPRQPGRFVAIVCTGGAAFDPGDPVCRRSDDAKAEPLRVYLGVIAANGDGLPRLVARGGPFDGKINWNSDMPAPEAVEDGGGTGLPQSFESFDLAPYRIAPGEPAFGLRAGWNYGYAGGFAKYQALYLFTVEGGLLRQVLATPMSAFKDIAGDWHKDGTRDHQITDDADILVVASHRTAGHFDLIVKAKNADPMARPTDVIIGVGIEFAIKHGRVEIVSLVLGKPAAMAGLRPGDVIARIDGKDLHGMSLKTIEARAREGTYGSKLTVTIARAGRQPFDVTLPRTLITLAGSAGTVFRWSKTAEAYRAAACAEPCL